jgi:hypothetical protein
MADIADIANEMRKHFAGGVTEAALIGIIAHLADLFPDMTTADLSAAMRRALRPEAQETGRWPCATRAEALASDLVKE